MSEVSKTLSIEPRFSSGKDPLAAIVWTLRSVRRQDGEQVTIEVPEGWTDTAARVFASHYLRVINGERETSARQAIDRVSRTVSEWALLDGYTDATNANNLRCEVAHMLVHQMWSPNSPVWYNIGTCEKPQLSACFIASVKDTMESLSALQTQETGLFRGGSGVGTNYSTLRHRNAPLSRGGSASGAASFLRGFDAWAGVTKSGGGTRRAAKMNVLNVSHPDIEQYVSEKAEAERMAWDLVDAGWPSDYNGPVYANLPFQNANHSVRISDAFMKAVDEGSPWDLKDHAGKVVKTVDARALWDQICTAAHTCGDPGLQFDDIINAWHTVPGSGRINASNPCQPDFATVLTPEGVRTFGDIGVGSIIWSGKRWTKVAKKWATGTKTVWAIRTDSGVFVGTENHNVISCGERTQAKDASAIDVATPPHEMRAEIETWLRGMGHSLLTIEKNLVSCPILNRLNIGDFPVYDITVEDEDHTYWTGGLLVSNCSEYLHVDDSACNLASLNLRKFHNGKWFNVSSFEHACRISITVQEIFVDRASYPTKLIEKNSHLFRPLGLGYANLGALLMSLGLPYDSDKGRDLCAAITSLMGASAYSQSQEIAKVKGCGKGIAANERNRKGIRWVIEKHCHASDGLPSDYDGIAERACDIWHYNVASHALPRNAQVTVLAPTGTIAFGMDCDTTGIEPDIALVKYKLLAGANAGYMTYANRSVEESLTALGYSEDARAAILSYVAAKQKIEGAPGLLDEHLPVFDCANRCASTTAEPGERYLSPEAHLRMMAAAQPFLSGGISKTVNLPHDATVEDISRTYRLAHTLGIKCVALFRDNCKASQPIAGATQNRLNEKHPHVRKAIDALAVAGGASPGMSLADTREALSKPRQPLRRRMPTTAVSRRVKFSVGGHEGYLHLGMHEDGSLGEVFVRMAKEGSTVSGLLDAWATMVSIALQYGAPLETLCEKMVGTTYAPHGFTGDDLRHASSLTDYIGRYLAANFVKGEGGEKESANAQEPAKVVQTVSAPASAETCPNKLCGGTTRKAGSCRVCERCGTTSGCG